MNNTLLRNFLRLSLLLLCCLGCACQAVKTRSAAVAPPQATTDAERLGDSLLETGRMKQAVAEYDRALASGADKASVAYRKGFVYFNEGKWEKSLQFFLQAQRLNPKMPIAYEGAGIASFQLGYLDQASDCFVKVMELAPGHWVSYAFMAGILAARNNMHGSREMHKKALKTAGPTQLRQVNTLLAEAYKRGKDLVREGKYRPGNISESPDKAEKAKGAAEPLLGTHATDEEINSNVYRSIKTLSPEEKAKVKQRLLGHLKKSEHKGAIARKKAAAKATAAEPQKTESAPQTTHSAAALNIEPLEDAEVRALLRAFKTGRLKEKYGATAENATKENTTPPAENNAGLSGTDQEAAEQQANTAPEAAQSGSSENALLRDLPQTGYSAMESSFPNSVLAEKRAKELQAKGLHPYVASVNLGVRGTWFRVLFGPFKTHAQANTMRKRLANDYGLTKAIVLKHVP